MKLKSIPHTIIVHTPTEAEAKELLSILHENGWKWCGEKSFHNLTNWDKNETTTCYKLYKDNKCLTYGYKSWFVDNNEIIHTLAEFKEKFLLNEDNFAKPEEGKPHPKFKVGEIVRYKGKRKVVYSINTTLSEPIYTSTMLDYQSPFNVEEHRIEPYTEPETKDDTKGKEPGESGNNSENSQLDLSKLLKGHEGEAIFLTTMGNVFIESISEINIRFKPQETAKDSYLLKASGKMNEHGLVIAFPSLHLYEQYPLDPYTAWMKWQEKQTIFHIRIEFQPYEERGEMKCGNMGTLHFDDLKLRTPADRDKCISEIKAIIEKYSK